jgi:FkbM family methyltransferase
MRIPVGSFVKPMSPKGLIQRQKQHLARGLVELFKAQLNFVPYRFGSEALWRGFVQPRLWCRRFDFTTRTNFGAKIIGSTSEAIQTCVLFFGDWEPNLTSFVRERLHRGDVFVDVGAYFGYYSLLAAGLVGKRGRVVAVEADPRNFSLLTRNLKCNRVQNVRALNVAASVLEGVVQLYTSARQDTGCTTTRKEWADRYGLKSTCQVAARPLASLLSTDEIRAARLIKIDAEGGEWDVVSGMTEMLPLCRQDIEIAIEVTPVCLEACGKSFQDLLDVFAPHGFCAYQLEEDVTPLSFVRKRSPDRPVRIRGPIVGQTEVILSRIDSERL